MNEIKDMPKLHSPFKRELINNKYVVTNQIEDGYEWVFEDDTVLAIEKLHGTNVSINIQDGIITGIWNRTERIPFFNRNKSFIVEGILQAYKKGYTEFLSDGQHFGELIGDKLQKNPYNVNGHLWIPFNSYAKKHLKYNCWGKYPKSFESISEWFKELMPLYLNIKGQKEGFVEGIVFTHPDGRMAKLRRDMFDWYNGKRHKQ